MSSTTTTVGNVVVVTHVLPAPPNAESHSLIGCGHRYRKGQPQALGTVQIMIGIMTLLFGIALLCSGESLGVYSGIFVWGAITYITSGSLTVAAGKSAKRCLINGALALNIIAAIFSLIGVILYSLDTVIWPPLNYPYYTYNYAGFSGVMAVFQFVEMVVAITAAGFSCSATCHCCAQPLSVVSTVDGPMTAQAPPLFQVAPAPYFPPQQVAPHFKTPADQADLGVPPAYQASN